MATSDEPLTTITISLSARVADKAEALADIEGRTLSDLFLRAFRAYQAAAFDQWWKELREYADPSNPHGYTEDDIPRLIKEVRAEMAWQR
jgi:hypothetical protein